MNKNCIPFFVIGKLLLIIGLTWFVCSGHFILSCIPGINNDAPYFGKYVVTWDNGWPGFAMIAIGFVFCLIPYFWKKNRDLPRPESVSPVIYLFAIIICIIICIIGIHAIAGLFIGLVYVVNHIDACGPYVIAFMIFAPVTAFAILYFMGSVEVGEVETKNTNSSNEDKCQSRPRVQKQMTTEEYMRVYNQNRALQKQKELDKIKAQEERRKASQQRKHKWVKEDKGRFSKLTKSRPKEV